MARHLGIVYEINARFLDEVRARFPGDNLLYTDPFLVCADFHHYVDCQARVDLASRDTARWSRMSILNVARSGYFSSDRAIREYSEDIWQIAPFPLETSRP